MRNKNVFPKSSGGWRERLGDKLRRFIGLHRLMVPIVTFVTLLVITLIGYAAFTRDDVRAADGLVVIINHDDVEQTVPTTPTTVGALLRKLDIKVDEGDVVEPSLDTDIRQDDFRINVYRSKPVEVVDQGRRTLTFSAAATPRSIAKQAGAQLSPEDELVTQPVTDFLKDRTIGARVIVDRAVPVIMNLYGEPVAIRTQAETVGDLLKERKIKLGEDDSVQPVATTKLTEQSQVFILRQGVKIASVTEEIVMPEEIIQDPTLAMGTRAVRQQGSPGQKVVTYQLNLENDKEVSRTVLQEVVSKTPVKQIVVQGTSLSGIKGNMGLAGIAPSDYNYADYVIQHESRWNPAALNAQGCAGLGQACPGSKLAAVCPQWQTDPVCQLRFFNKYAVDRYGGWAGAYQKKINSGWW